MKILIKNVLLGEERVDILVNENLIEKIASKIEDKEAEVFDASNLAALPAFYNMHTHSSMTLLRGFCEDLPLFDWLNNIWKKEAELSSEDIYNGTRLAILEMIKSGTVFFADMYWHHASIIKAVEEMGIRANIGICFMNSLGRKTIDECFDYAKNKTFSQNSLLSLSIAPHAIYTCDRKLYEECYRFAKDNDLIFHTHLSETQKEVEDSLKENGLRPVEYLNSLGVLDNKTLLAHCVHLSEKEAEILSQTRSTLVHNPCSNMKLASGVFDSRQARKYNCNIALGTDGNSSNNNLSMIEEMKIASLLAKVHYLDSEEGNSNQVFQWATKNGAEAVGINAGEIKEGKLADLMFVNLDNEKMQPNYNIISNLIYSADTSCVDSLMCDGKFVMKHYYVEGEEEIIEIAKDINKKMRKIALYFLCIMVSLYSFSQGKESIQWVKVEGGTFLMGCKAGEEDCYPDEMQHKVSLSTFYISKYEITVAQYRYYCEQTGKSMPQEPVFGWQDNAPIVNVTWQEAKDYAKWVGGRLPTEAEWEFAARGGNKSKGFKYSGGDNPLEVGWCFENAEKTTHPVGEKLANELGLYDMSGNAWEWCEDNYEIYYYKHSPEKNPKGPAKGLGKVNRGGCYNFDYHLMKPSHRRGSGAESIGTGTGFRIVK